jgi:hypothetical protein
MNNALYMEALNKFYSPAILAAHAKVDGQFAVLYKDRIETARAAAASVQQQGGAVRQQGNSPVARNDSRTPAKPAVTAVGPPDLGIAKARAANVDTKLFGIPLGEPLAIPKCAGGLFETPSTNCFETHEMLEGLAAAIMGVKPEAGGPTEVTIQLTPGNCPTWMDACSFNATIQNGRFVAARLGTKGRDVEAAVGKELRGKYGQRASMQQRFITPNNGGGKFQSGTSIGSSLGCTSEYKVVNATILDGSVGIESETIYAVRKAKDREAAKPKRYKPQGIDLRLSAFGERWRVPRILYRGGRASCVRRPRPLCSQKLDPFIVFAANKRIPSSSVAVATEGGRYSGHRALSSFDRVHGEFLISRSNRRLVQPRQCFCHRYERCLPWISS